MHKTTTEKKLSKENIMPGMILSLAISFILFLYAPIELYCTNLDEFWFDFGKLLLLIFGMFISGLLLMVCFYVVLLLIHPMRIESDWQEVYYCWSARIYRGIS